MLKFFKQLLMFHVKHSMSDEDGGGAGGSDGGSEGGSNEGLPQKPGFVQDKFWDNDKGEVRIEALSKSYGELETKISTAANEAVEKYKKEIEGTRPGSPDEYKVQIPEGFFGDDVKIEIPDNDPMLNWFKGFAHEKGLSVETFNEAVAHYIKNEMEAGAALQGSISELGENGQERVDRVDLFLQRTLTDDEYLAVASIAKSPKAIIAIEKIMAKGNEPNLFKDGDSDTGGVTREQLKEMMKDPRYWKTKDAAFIKEVQDAYAKLYPGEHKDRGKAA